MQFLHDEVWRFNQTQLFKAFGRQPAHSKRNILALMHRLKSIAPHFFQSDLVVVRQGHQLVRIRDHRELFVDFLDKRYNFRLIITAADGSGFQLKPNAMANIFQLVQIFVIDVFIVQRLSAVVVIDQMRRWFRMEFSVGHAAFQHVLKLICIGMHRRQLHFYD